MIYLCPHSTITSCSFPTTPFYERCWFQVMLGNLKDMPSDFAKSLYRNLCTRLLQRRSVASRVSRFLRKKGKEETKLDRWLREVQEEIIAEGNEKTYNTFADPGDIANEISKFEQLEENRSKSTTRERDGQHLDDYEALMDVEEDDDEPPSAATSHHPTTRELIDLHSRGFRTLPESLSTVISVLQPTSVPSERAFSVARHSRRHCQERLLDERFTNYLLLKDFYRKSKPWVNFVDENGIPMPASARDPA